MKIIEIIEVIVIEYLRSCFKYLFPNSLSFEPILCPINVDVEILKPAAGMYERDSA